MFDQFVIGLVGVLSMLFGYGFFTIAMDDLGETIKGRVSGVLTVGFFIIMMVTTSQIG